MIGSRSFVFPGIRSRVVFGSGTLAQVASEMERLGRRKALVLTTPTRLPASVATAIKAVRPTKVVVLGGNNQQDSGAVTVHVR